MKIMKKVIAIVLLLATCLCVTSCYRRVRSTKEERETVLTMTVDGTKYEVAYELYRAFFLQLKSEVDGGDESVWTSENKDEYITRIDAMIYSRIADVYAVIHLCDKVGINLYSRTVKKTIKNYIKASVEGGAIDDAVFEGFGGNYKAYLAHLKSMNLNYSVQELLFRYTIANILLTDYYESKITDGEYNFTRDDVKAFYDSDDCVRVLQMYLSTTTEVDRKINTPERAEKLRNDIAELYGEYAVGTYMISNSLATEDLRGGFFVGKWSLDPMYYEELTAAAFSLEKGETSAVIEVTTGASNGYFILYRCAKNDENFNDCYDDIEDTYVQNRMGEDIESIKVELVKSASQTSVLQNLDRSTISMD